MRLRDTVRVRIAGHQTWIDPGVLTQALARQEGAMDRVTAWSDEDGLLICRLCAEDVIAGGFRVIQTRVSKGRICSYCDREIGGEESQP